MTMGDSTRTGFYIGVTCPGCGGELELQENFFSLECRYCSSVLRVIMPETPPAFIIPARKSKREARFQIDRFLKKRRLPLTRSDFSVNQFYFPYWKIEAIRLGFEKRRQIKKQQIDYNSGDMAFYGLGAKVTQAASATRIDETRIVVNLAPFSATQTAGPHILGLPTSLGLRTDYVRAFPFSYEQSADEFDYYPVTSSWDQVKGNMVKSASTRARLNAASSGSARNELFNLKGSIVYFPYIRAVSDTASEMDYFLVDGLTGRVVYAGPVPDEPAGHVQGLKSRFDFARLGVDFHRCRNCGVDLPASRSAVYICHNCNSVISLDGNLHLPEGMKKVIADRPCTDQLFPFWSFTVDPRHIRGLLNPAGLAGIPDRLIIPAFRVSNFEALHRLCRRASGGIPEFSLQPITDCDDRLRTVDIGLREATALGEIIIYRDAIAKNPSVSAADFKLNPSRAGVIFIPFHPQHYFYVDSLNGNLTFERSLIGTP